MMGMKRGFGLVLIMLLMFVGSAFATVDYYLELDIDQDGIPDTGDLVEGQSFDIIVTMDSTVDFTWAEVAVDPDDSSIAEISFASSGNIVSSAVASPNAVTSSGGYSYGETSSTLTSTPASSGYTFVTFTADALDVGSTDFDFTLAEAGVGRTSHTVNTYSLPINVIAASSGGSSGSGSGGSSSGGSGSGSSGAYDVSFLMLRDSDQDGIPDRKAIREGDPFDVLIYAEALNDFDSVSFDIVSSLPSVATVTQGVSGDLLDGVATSNVGSSSGTWAYSQSSSSAVLPSGRSHLATFSVSPGSYGTTKLELQGISVSSGGISRTFTSQSLNSLEVFATSGFTSLDNDGDGVTADVDCDDNDAGQRVADYYYDLDGDGYGDASQTSPLCRVLFLEIDAQNNLDCDDSNFYVNSGASEICDAIDNDCDGLVDDTDSSVDSSTMSTFYLDSDRDGYGDSPKRACAAPPSYVDLMPDCNDVDASINPGATEICADGMDNNCDGAIDDFDSSGVSCTSTTYTLPTVSEFFDMLKSHFRSPLTTTEELDYDFDQSIDSAGILDLGDIREYICLKRTGSACGGSS